MTTLSDTPGEGLDPNALDLVCVEWPHMPRDVLSEIVDDYLAASRSPSVASDTAALPSGYEGLVEELKDVVRLLDFEGYVGAAQSVSEAIAALGRVQPVADEEAARLFDDKQPMACEAGKMTAAEDVLAWLIIEKIGVPDDCAYTPHPAQKIIEAALATPPAPQPALALIEELTGALEQQHRWHLNSGTIGLPDDEGGWVEIDNAAEYSDSTMHNVTVAALASAKRFKGE